MVFNKDPRRAVRVLCPDLWRNPEVEEGRKKGRGWGVRGGVCVWVRKRMTGGWMMKM